MSDPGEHTTDPVGHSTVEFHVAELQDRWLDENPGKSEADYEVWKQANSSSSSSNPTSVFDTWAQQASREQTTRDEQAKADLHLAQVIADAEAQAAGWANAHALFDDVAHNQLWDALFAPDLAPLRTALGVGPTDPIPGLDDTQAAVRRSSRSLVSFCSATSQAATRAIVDTNMGNRSVTGQAPTAQEYANQFQALVKAVTTWQDVVADDPNPDVNKLADAATEVRNQLQTMLIFHGRLELAYRHYSEAIPDTIGVGVRLRLAALSNEIARQFASRCALPQASLMCDRIGEDPRRETDQTVWDADIQNGFKGNPRLLSDTLTRQMMQMAMDPQLSADAKNELTNAVKSKWLPKLGDAVKAWEGAFDPAKPDRAGMADAVNRMMFTLTAYRDAIARANLRLVDLVVLAAPIDALQDYLEQMLQRLLPPRSPSSVSSTGASSSGSSSSSGRKT